MSTSVIFLTQESSQILLKAKILSNFGGYSLIPLHSDTNFVKNLENTYPTVAKIYDNPLIIFKDDLFFFEENENGVLLLKW